MYTDVLWSEPEWAEVQVLRIQTTVHRWATDDYRPADPLTRCTARLRT